MVERVWPVFVASVLVVAAVLAVVPRDDEAVVADPVEELLAAYERSRTATFVVEQRFTRRAEGGRELSYDLRLVQRPPEDRFVVGGGQAQGRLDGRLLLCSTTPDGRSRCDEGAEAPPYAEQVAEEVAALRALVEGDAAVYDVRAGEPGCWSLHLRREVLTPPYGELAGFCFDEATGAPLRTEIHREGTVDIVEAQEIRTDVTSADLRPGDLGDLPTG